LLSVMFITIAIRLFAQEVSTASIIVDGQRSTIRFTNINGEAFVSWLDLAKLMPRILSLSAKGEIIATTTNAGQPSVEDLLRAMGSASAPTGDAIESRIDGEFTG